MLTMVGERRQSELSCRQLARVVHFEFQDGEVKQREWILRVAGRVGESIIYWGCVGRAAAVRVEHGEDVEDVGDKDAKKKRNG